MSAAQAEKTKAPIKHTFSMEVDIDPDFIEYLIKYRDIFDRNRAGYWAFGVKVKTGWLVYEQEDDDAMPTDKATREAKSCYGGAHDGNLPERWYLLDRDAAIRAWCEGVKRWGVDWYEDVDAEREDVVVQLALLGEIRYG
jgi:hypothetical protein